MWAALVCVLFAIPSSSNLAHGIVKVSFSESKFYVNETTSYGTVTLKTSQPTVGEINVTVAVLGGSATFGSDYRTLSQDVTFGPGDQMKTVEIRILDDGIREPAEDIRLLLFIQSSSLDVALPGFPSSASLIIIDDEFLGISFKTWEIAVEEGDNFVVQLRSQESVDFQYAVNLVFTDITANSGSYRYNTSSTPSVTFTSGNTLSSVFAVSTISNSIWEGSKILDISIDPPTNLGFTVKAVYPEVLRVFILDDDYVTVFFQESTLTVREDVGTISLRLSSSGAIYTAAFNVSIYCHQTQPAQAKNGVDFEHGAYTVQFSDFNSLNTTSSAAVIKILDDQVTESTEAFSCIILTPTGAATAGILVGQPRTTSVTIEDNDVTVQFNMTEVTVEEGNMVDIQLVAEGTFNKDFTVDLVFTNGTAEYPQDYTYGGTNSVTFTSGSSVSSVYRLSTVHNNVWKGKVFFVVGLKFRTDPSANFNLVLGGADTLRVNVLEVDTVSISMERTAVTVKEDVGTVPLRLTSKGAYITTFALPIVCSAVQPPQAEAGADFKGTPYIVQFNDFNSEQSLSSVAEVEIINDTMAEFTESFVCVVSTPDGEDKRGIVVVDPNNVTISIEDNDEILVRFANTTQYTVDEDVGSFDVYFEALREVSPGVYVPAEYTFDFVILVKTVDGTDTDDSDLEEKEESVTFSAGDQFSAPFTVRITDDTVAECTEQFTITYNISARARGLGVRQLDSTATVDVIDNDVVKISFKTGSLAVIEHDGVVKIRLIADNVFEREQFLDILATNETAFDEGDFALVSDKVRFPPNSSLSDPLIVKLIDNFEVENYETFSLHISIPATASSCGARYGVIRKLDVLIHDDDGLRVGFIPDQKSVVGAEGQTVSLKVYLDGCNRRSVRVGVVIEPVTASGSDYFLITKTITFGANPFHCFQLKDIKIRLSKDSLREGLESFKVRLTDASTDEVGFDRRELPVFIIDLAAPPTRRPPSRPSHRGKRRPGSSG